MFNHESHHLATVEKLRHLYREAEVERLRRQPRLAFSVACARLLRRLARRLDPKELGLEAPPAPTSTT